MAIQVALEHRTVYRFDRLVRLSPHVVRLRPAPSCRTPILAYSLRVEPEGHFINWQQDPFGNDVARLVFPEPTRVLSITVDVVAEMTVVNPFDFFLDPDAERYPFRYGADLARDLAPYRHAAQPGRLLRDWLAEVRVPAEGEPTVDFLVGLNRRVLEAVAYTTRFEPGVQTPEETLEKGMGSCRDSAWLLTQILRSVGLAARFVSGYLVQLEADQPSHEGLPGPAADFTDLHAWSEVYVPGAGWIGLDPTSGLLAGEGHLPLACTPDPASAAAVTGYDEARRSRLGTEKFQLGGPTPADSPLLRRPDLLRSLITYWQHHPSLSYLFSGRFIGPTSQAPRVDEARNDSLYDLEIAFAQLGDPTGAGPPWRIDRLLRNLLVDVAGNTHRAEFCIDKLFNPDSERGRLGLLELRAFEMPPHPQMALVQALLVRALVARFWREAYSGDLVRWGCDLHDRFMLPWYVAADISEVVRDLHEHGMPFEETWLAPFIEFRFPRLGSVQVGDTTIELRTAIEPWPVLGEEVGRASSARYVDSSTERIQVLVSGLTEGRHVVTCNGHPIPLQRTERAETFAAGVRYKAWKPPSALHPTIGVHAPLVFDLIDRWSSRSLGGCTYHVSHPGGRSYHRLPVNANEAEARRASRFDAKAHTPGLLNLAALDRAINGSRMDPEYPRTLDLRRVPTS